MTLIHTAKVTEIPSISLSCITVRRLHGTVYIFQDVVGFKTFFTFILCIPVITIVVAISVDDQIQKLANFGRIFGFGGAPNSQHDVELNGLFSPIEM